MNPDDILNYAAAIRSIESSGNYGARGPATRNGDRAYGAYQVMGNNIPSWTQKHYGQSLTPQQFLQDKAAQDAVFNGEFGGYVQKHGNPQDAASMWFSGRPVAQAGNSSDGYNTVPQYIQKFNKALGQDGGGALSAIENAAPSGTSMPPGALGFAAAGQGGSAPQQQASNGVLFQGEQPNKLHGIGATLANVGAAIAGISNPSQANSLRGIAQGIEAQSHGKFQYQMGPNGQLLRINKETNAVDSISIPDAQKESYKPIMGKDDMGNPTLLGSYNEKTGEYKPVGGGNAATPGPTFGGDPNLTGQERYATLKPEEQRQIDAWHEGTGIQPSQYSMRNNPKLVKLMDAAQAVYPDMDFQKYGERQQFLRGYGNKAPSAFGGQLVSIEHTAELVGQQADRYAKLGNSSGGIGGYGATATNYGKNLVGGNARAATLNEIKGASETLSGEYQTMITRGKGGGQAERAEYAGNVNKGLAAPEVQAAGLQVMLDGLKARHNEIVEAAKSAAGQTWLEKHPDVEKKITETMQKVQTKIDALNSKSKTKADDAPAAKPAAAPPIPSGWKVY